MTVGSLVIVDEAYKFHHPIIHKYAQEEKPAKIVGVGNGMWETYRVKFGDTKKFVSPKWLKKYDGNT